MSDSFTRFSLNAGYTYEYCVILYYTFQTIFKNDGASMNIYVFSPDRVAFTLMETLVALVIIGILVGLLFPAVFHLRCQARRSQCQNNMRQIGLAFANNEQAMGSFVPSRTRFPIQSGWLLEIQPYLEGSSFVTDWNARQTWYESDNAPLLTKTNPLFQCPSTSDKNRTLPVNKDLYNRDLPKTVEGISGDYFVHYGGISLPDARNTERRNLYENALCDDGSRTSASSVMDGLGNTVLINEQAGRPVCWVRGKKKDGVPEEVWRSLWVVGPTSYLHGFTSGDSLTEGFDQAVGVCNSGIYSFHDNGANTLFMDGSARFVSNAAVAWIVLAFNTRNGSENVGRDDLSRSAFDESFVNPKTGRYPDGTTP